MSPDERAIRDVIGTWLRASAAGDNETVLGLMADDVVFLVAGRPPFGKAEFAATSDALRTHRIEAASDVREVVVSGDMAYARSQLTVTMTPVAGGAPSAGVGRCSASFDGRRTAAGCSRGTQIS